MKNIKLTLEYDGTRYSGWQRLGKGESQNTIENKLLEVLKKMSGETPDLHCACRTEKGVHAYAQVISFQTNTTLDAAAIKQYCNRYLPMDIAVLEAEAMPPRFHASLNAISKTYQYKISIGDVPSVFERKYSYYCFKQPDLAKMRDAAALLLGKHDFKNFSTVKRSKSTEKDLQAIDIYGDSEAILITITASDFLHNMARIIVATLLEIGLDKRPASDITKLLKPDSPVLASPAADAKGLFLSEVKFNQAYLSR